VSALDDIKAEVDAKRAQRAKNANGGPPPGDAQEAPPRSTLRNPDPGSARPVRWAWRHRVAIGKLNLLVGNEGAGKGVVNAWQAAMLSHGRLDGDLKGRPANVLIVGDEDALEDTWTPRLYAVEADWRRVFFPPQDIGDLDITTDQGINTLAGWVYGHDIAVVVFDALLDNIGSADAYQPKEVRAALRPLRRFAAGTDVAVLGSLHPRKGDVVSFRDLVAGSHQFNAVSRSSLLIAEHPHDPRRRVLIRGKGNLSMRPDPLEFEIKSCAFQLNGALFDQPIATDWETSDIDIEDVLPRRSRESKQDSAGHWLRAYLDADWTSSADVKAAGEQAGFNERMLQRAIAAMVDDGEAEIRNVDTVPRRTDWRLS
jgi:AAA domain